MVTGADIEYLIWTYDLPETKGRKIRDIIVRQLETIGFTSYDELYKRVGELVEAFTQEFGSKYWLRLDQGVTEDSRHPLHDIFGIEETVENNESEEENIGTVSINDALHLLSSKLNPAQIAVLEFLSRQNGNGQIIISPDELMQNIDNISERLEELVRVYEKDGRILIPRRPIVEIKWNPRLWVKFGQRKFNGNPLQFFRDNIDIYGGMGRTNLWKFDSGLYQALLNYNQMAEAIPTVDVNYRKLSLRDRIRLCRAYYDFDCRSVKTAHLFHLATATVLRVWRNAGLEIRLPGYKYGFFNGSDELKREKLYGTLGTFMAESILNRNLFDGEKIRVGDRFINLSESVHYDEACDAFGILSHKKLERYVKDYSWLVRKVGNKHIDARSALYLGTLEPVIGLRGGVCYNFVAVITGLSLEETEKLLNLTWVKRFKSGCYKLADLRRKIFNPAFEYALKYLDL